MSHPTGDCPICKRPFMKADDIVICPNCGAPYHRACYGKQARCSFADKHAAGFEYRSPKEPNPPPQPPPAGQKQTGGMLCPACGTVNEAAPIYCENCGVPLHPTARAEGRAPGGGFFGGPVPGYAAAADMKGEIDGIPKRDWAAFIGHSAPTYLMRLAQMQQRGRKVSFMFSAFLFPPVYFAYRKMWRWALAALAGTLVLMIPQFLFISAEAGSPLLPGLDAQILNVVSLAGAYLSLFVRLLFAMYALDLYRKNAAKRIQDIRSQAGGDPDVQNTLAKQGGVSVVGVVLVYLMLTAFNLLAWWMIGDAYLAYVSPLATQLI